MNTAKVCVECGGPIPLGRVSELCPACLLKQGLRADSGEGAAFEPPPVTGLAQLFPQLEIIELIGRGGMAAVYKARQPALDRMVALKILPKRVEAGAGFSERFNREARALARLSHPNILAVFDFGQVEALPDGHLHYFIMEYVDGVNLRQLQKASRLSPREALQIVPQICDALQYAHDQGVVHRDIKPENVLVDRSGRVKIADFGLARIVGTDVASVRLTREGDVMGTPHYMAPEQFERPLEVDHRADIYSLGVVFYELLTGELPIGKFAPPSRKVQLDVRLDDVVLRALEKEPQQRYQRAGEVKTAVQNVSQTKAQLRRDNRVRPLMAAGLIIGASILVASLWFWRRGTYYVPPAEPPSSLEEAQPDAPAGSPGVAGQMPLDTPQMNTEPPPPDWSKVFVGLNSQDWRNAFALGQRVAALPPDDGWALLQQNWPALTNASAKQQLLKAFSSARHARLLNVLELGLLDAAPEVQSWAMLYLKPLALRDFSTDYEGAKAWMAANRGRSNEEVVRDSAYWIAGELRGATGEQLLNHLEILKRESSYLGKQPEAAVAAGLDSLLAQLAGLDEKTAALAIGAAGKLNFDDNWCREVLLPRLAPGTPVEITRAAIQGLGKKGREWALEPLAKVLGEAVTSSSAGARRPLIWAAGTACNEIGSPAVIPTIIGAIEADNTYDTIYGLGYFGLRDLTGVTYSEKHDGAWWRQWWEKNKHRYPAHVQALQIPQFSKDGNATRQ